MNATRAADRLEALRCEILVMMMEAEKLLKDFPLEHRQAEATWIENTERWLSDKMRPPLGNTTMTTTINDLATRGHAEDPDHTEPRERCLQCYPGLNNVRLDVG